MERVLVTGAGGFIGGRIVERLRSEPGVEAIAMVRSYKGCARVARLGVQMVRCDITDRSELSKVVRNATSVIHCAMSDGPSIVDGTRNIIECAQSAGVGKVVHLSTGDIYSAATGSLEEDSARDRVGDWYSDAKREAEDICEEAIGKGLPITRLRPGIVYGPFCYAWTQRIGMRIANRQVSLLPEVQNGICNAVFVDDVVEACALFRRPGFGDGDAFNINGPERISWNEYFLEFAAALEVAPPKPASAGRTTVKSALLEPARTTARWLLKRYQKQIMAIYARSSIANRLMKRMEGAFRATPEARELGVYSRRVELSDRRLRNTFPRMERTQLRSGLKICAEYLKVFGLVE